MEDELPNARLHDNMAKKRLKTFSDIRKKTSSNNVTLQADMNVFANIVPVAGSRHLQMSEVLPHPLGPLPWALANGDGTPRKKNKTALARELELQVLPT